MFLRNLLNFWITDLPGELAALGAACLWAIATIIYGRLGRDYPPLELNLLKGVIAIALIILTLFLSNEQLQTLDFSSCVLLMLSGVVGIALGDTANFAAINCLGPRRAILMETSAPPLVAIIALIFLQEKLTITDWCGIFVTVIGIAWVVTEQVPNSTVKQEQLFKGIGFGFLAAIAQATGAVISRAVLTQTTISPLFSAFWRLSGGVIILLLFTGLFRRKFSPQLTSLPTKKALGAIFLAAFIGTYLAIWLQQTAFKFTTAGIAQTLLATSPLFVLMIVVWMGEVVSLRAIAGVLVAIGGVALLLGFN
ncbi:MAG: DMT family transporter [Symploca sp. SIO1B1]|nr:DMT family transporter [Symploca sp. SIO2D2]NER96073.1 DMT family transporter [Symploca sp. SIO1B1]